MPVGTQASVKAVAPRDLDAMGTEIILGNTYHLFLRPGLEVFRTVRRPAQVHELAQADPDRQRRLPGLQPRQAARDHRGRRRVPLASRRLQVLPRAEGGDRDPARARLGHHDGLRRMPALALRGGEGRTTPCSAPSAGRAPRSIITGTSSPRNRTAQPLEQALFGIVQGGSYANLRARMRRARWWKWISTATPSAGSAWANRRRRCTRPPR